MTISEIISKCLHVYFKFHDHRIQLECRNLNTIRASYSIAKTPYQSDNRVQSVETGHHLADNTNNYCTVVRREQSLLVLTYIGGM